MPGTFSMSKKFEAPVTFLKCKYIDRESGFTEVERYISINQNGEIIFDQSPK